MSDLTGKVAIVTGGASGIGRATALLFASKGCQVMLADSDRQGGEAVLGELGRGGTHRGAYQPVHVADAAQVATVVNETVARFGRLDILVNAAGIYPTFEEITEYQLVVNRATAKRYGMNLPQSVLIHAHEVIE